MTENARGASEYGTIWYRFQYMNSQNLYQLNFTTRSRLKELGKVGIIESNIVFTLLSVWLNYVIAYRGPIFGVFSPSKSKTAAVLTPTIQKVEDEECQESDIFMEILVVFVNPQITCLNTEGKHMTS